MKILQYSASNVSEDTIEITNAPEEERRLRRLWHTDLNALHELNQTQQWYTREWSIDDYSINQLPIQKKIVSFLTKTFINELNIQNFWLVGSVIADTRSRTILKAIFAFGKRRVSGAVGGQIRSANAVSIESAVSRYSAQQPPDSYSQKLTSVLAGLIQQYRTHKALCELIPLR